MPDGEGAGVNVRSDMRGVLPVGTELCGYELKSILGQGAFGITYRARDIALDRDVAIKEYLPTALALREGRTTVVPRSADHAEQFAWGRERFLDEARTLAGLAPCPAIVRFHDFFEANGTAYMVMALIEGETLNKRLMREQRLTPEALERLLFPLLDGLELVHAAGFLHRDIKPGNIMVDTGGRPTLIDFGAARAAIAGRSTTLTAIFTPGYAAAEQFTSSRQGPWTDIYGLAATFYEAITGQIPPSAVARVLQDAYQPLGKLRPPGYRPALLAGIDAGLATRVEDRPQSIAEWRHILLSEESSSGKDPTRVTQRKRQARITIRGPALWAAAGALILALAGAGYLAYQANAPGTVSTAALGLSAEQLEQALAERRQADTLAAEKRRLEDEARTKAEAEAAAKRQAEAALEQARQARQKAEAEVTRLGAAAGSRQPADTQAEGARQRAAEEEARTEAASRRQTEEEAAKRVAADAEAKRRADEALAKAEAERQQAEAEARTKAEAETRARRQAEEAQAKALAEREKADAEAKLKGEAEAAERGLRLESTDRQRLQVALTSLGFDTRGNDGLFGPRSREMIAAWQQRAEAPATGFLTTSQRDQLLRNAAPAVARWDEEQKKIEEEKTRTDPARPATATAAPARAAAPGVAGTPTSQALPSPDGLWRGTYSCEQGVGTGSHTNTYNATAGFTTDVSVRLTNGSGVWKTSGPSNGNGNTFEIQFSVDGRSVNIKRLFLLNFRSQGKDTLSGQYDGNAIRANGVEAEPPERHCVMTLARAG